jgi:hypothetical protein
MYAVGRTDPIRTDSISNRRATGNAEYCSRGVKADAGCAILRHRIRRHPQVQVWQRQVGG